jgi:hypothetical protein
MPHGGAAGRLITSLAMGVMAEALHKASIETRHRLRKEASVFPEPVVGHVVG